MAKNYQGILGNFSGKVGNVVGRVRDDRTVVAVYQPNVLNPQTSGQMAQRQKLSIVSEFLRGAAGFVNKSMKGATKYGTGWSATLRYAMMNAVVGTYPNMEIDATKIALSVGNVDLPFTPSMDVDSGTATFTWADNTGMGNALATDTICVAFHNDDKNQWIGNETLAARSDRTAQFVLPTGWSGDTVQAYMWVRRGYTAFSNTRYAGSVDL